SGSNDDAGADHDPTDAADLFAGNHHLALIIHANHHCVSLLAAGSGAQEAPSNQILIALALFLSFFIMNPTLTAIYNDAYEPWSKGEIDQAQALERGSQPLKQFMLRSTPEKDLQLFIEMSARPKPKEPDDLPM